MLRPARRAHRTRGSRAPAPRPRPALAKRTRCSCRRALDPKSFCVCEKRDMKKTQCRPATSKPSVALSCRPGTRGCGHLGTAAPPRPGRATSGRGGPSPRVASLWGARRTFSGTAEGKAAAGPRRARKRPLCGVTWRGHLTHGDLARWAPPPRAPCASNRFCRGPARVVTTPRPAQPAWPRSAGATGGSTAGPVTGSQRDDAGAAPAASSETPRREAAGLGDGNRGSDSDRAAQASRRRGAARRDAETSPQHRRNGCASSARNAPERRSQTARAPRRVRRAAAPGDPRGPTCQLRWAPVPEKLRASRLARPVRAFAESGCT